jgi:hypothetical protein
VGGNYFGHKQAGPLAGLLHAENQPAAEALVGAGRGLAGVADGARERRVAAVEDEGAREAATIGAGDKRVADVELGEFAEKCIQENPRTGKKVAARLWTSSLQRTELTAAYIPHPDLVGSELEAHTPVMEDHLDTAIGEAPHQLLRSAVG